jgi:hypothetical protein
VSRRVRRSGAGGPAAVLAGLALVACGSGDGIALDTADLAADSLLTAELPGTANPRTVEANDGGRPSLTVLMDVTGDWEAVSVSLARAARAHGWAITSTRCVGTGNDVIGGKQIAGTWVLLESGAGTRGAGIILRYDPDQSPPGVFSADPNCPRRLTEAANGP